MKVLLAVVLALAVFVAVSEAKGGECHRCTTVGGIGVPGTACKHQCELPELPVGDCEDGLKCCAFTRS